MKGSRAYATPDPIHHASRLGKDPGLAERDLGLLGSLFRTWVRCRCCRAPAGRRRRVRPRIVGLPVPRAHLTPRNRMTEISLPQAVQRELLR
jgi:hypothetical protein